MVIVKFSSQYCKPCEEMSNRLDKLGLEWNEVDVEECESDVLREWGVMNLPTLFFINRKNEIEESLVGLVKEEKIWEIVQRG
jgi:glutaredoxin